MVCLWEGCERPIRARRLCQMHYDHLRRTQPKVLKRYPPTRTKRPKPGTPFRRGTMWFKQCAHCKRVLPSGEFNVSRPSKRDPQKKGGREAPYLKSWCHACTRSVRPQRSEASLRQKAKYQREWQQRNRGRINALNRQRRRARGHRLLKDQPEAQEWLRRAPRSPDIWLNWKDRKERSIRRRTPHTIDLDGKPEWGLYMERVAVTKDDPPEHWVLDMNGKIVGAYSSVPPSYRKFVFGCRNRHSSTQLGPDPGPCEQCRADKAPFVPSSVRLS